MEQNQSFTSKKSDLAAARAANLRANLLKRKAVTRARAAAPAVLESESTEEVSS